MTQKPLWGQKNKNTLGQENILQMYYPVASSINFPIICELVHFHHWTHHPPLIRALQSKCRFPNPLLCQLTLLKPSLWEGFSTGKIGKDSERVKIIQKLTFQRHLFPVTVYNVCLKFVAESRAAFWMHGVAGHWWVTLRNGGETLAWPMPEISSAHQCLCMRLANSSRAQGFDR